jgi:hypothetical protein
MAEGLTKAERLTENMAQGLTNDLLLAAFTIWLLGLWVCSRDLPFLVALVVTSIKVAIPVAYFAWFFDGTWILQDDLVYLSRGSEMLQQGYTPLTALIDAQGGYLWLISSKLYEWWNLLGQWFFGRHYYAPVFLNVLLTFVGGHFLFKLARSCGFSEGYAKGLLLFFLFHWEVLAWSSFINLKDVLTMTLTIMGFYFILKLSKQMTFRSLVALGLIILALLGIRWYIPAFMLITGLIWGVLCLRGRRRQLLLLGLSIGSLAIVGLLTVLIGLVPFLYFLSGAAQVVHASAIIYGPIHLLLTPQPWWISPEYSFLLLPSVLHWLLLLPALFGGWMLWRRSREAALLLIYLVIVLLLYGIIPELQGPRHRFQVAFIIAWVQFHFFWVMVREAVSQAALGRAANEFREGKVQQG